MYFMAAKNHKSSTLPSSLRHGVSQTDESEGFFSKLKKKLKLKKGKYHVDVNTGDCENISAVSFRKRESREVSDDECPWKLRDPASEELSPNLSKKAPGRQSERVTLGIKVKERKYSNPETSFIRPQNLGINSDLNDFQRSSLGSRGKVTKSTNEYSPLTYDTKDSGNGRSRKLRESSVTNECVLHDDSAIDLDCESDSVNRPSVPDDLNYDMGYEKLPEKGSRHTKSLEDTCSSPEFDPNYESVEDVKSRIKGSKSKDRVDFDPNYESVDEVKDKIRKSGFISPYGTSEHEPGYQSINNLKRESQKLEPSNAIRPPKTYNVNQSIESLDEPGYESLNDVKKRIGEQNVKKAVGNGKIVQKDHISSPDTMETDELNDSAIGSVSNIGSLSLSDLSRKRSKSGDEAMARSDGGQGLLAFTQMAVSLTGFAHALTESGRSKDSGFDSKEKNLNLEQEESSKVRAVKKDDASTMYSTVNKSQTNSLSSAGTDNVESKTVPEPSGDGYDSDLELMLDPGYAECADAIKGIIPGFSIYSDGSGSKISSCTSLDLSAEDFALEPGYAECADAIKSGAIKKISLSYERLVDHSDHSSEIYANPQILFRKRSKLLEEVKGDSGEKSLAERDLDLMKEHEICLALENKQKKKEKKNKKTKEKQKPPEAPPLPARNYSLYLDNEEADKEVKEVLDDIAVDSVNDAVLDDAFETNDIETSKKVEPDTASKGDPLVNTVESSISFPSDNIVESPYIKPKKCVECGKVLNETMSSESATNTSSQRLISNSSGNDSRESDCVNDALCVHCYTEKTDKIMGNSMRGLERENNKCEQPGHFGNDHKAFESHGGEGVEAKHNTENKEKTSCEEMESFKELGEELTDEKQIDDVLHITVEGESGLKTVLTVLEKQESIEVKRKREIGKKKVSQQEENRISEEDEASRTCENCLDCDSSDERVEMKDNLMVGSFSFDKLKNVDVTSVVRSENMERSTSKEKDYLKSHIGLDCNRNDDISKSNSGKLVNMDITSSNTYQPSISSMFNENSSGNTDTGNFLSVAVKMKTISVDSDSDLFNSEDLPKLEIHESDLDSAFDSSDNSTNLDIGSESAGIDKLTERLNIEACPTQTKELDNVMEVGTENKNMVEDDGSDRNINKDANSNSDPGVLYLTENAEESKNTMGIKSKEEPVFDFETKHVDVIRNNLADQTNQQNMDNTEMTVQQFDSALKMSAECEQWRNAEKVEESGSGLHERSVEVSIDKSSSVSDDIENSFNTEKLDVTDKNSTLESRVCVTEGENDQIVDGADITDYPEIAQCSVHANDNYTCVGSAIDFNSEDQIDGNIAGVDSNEQIEVMHLIYEQEHPSLYADNEPTHMSLQEAMGVRSNCITRSLSDCSGQGLSSTPFPDAFIMHSIPNDYSSIDSEEVTPPPRAPRPPPSTNTGQSNSKVSFSSPEGWNSTDLLTDEQAVLLRLCESSHSEDGSPPVVPPRMPLKEKNARSSKRPVSYSQDFMESMRQLKDCGWYWGPLSWEEAELKLAKKPEGTFLVRDSSDEHYILSLSFKNQGRVHHTRIEHHKGHFSFWSQPDSHGKSTIKEFIEQCVENSRNGRFLYFIRPSGPGSPPMPIQLLHPVSRFIQMRSLQHMCRFRILQLVRRDHIDLLPVPKRIKQYLNEAQYYVEYLED